jgi:hypothetical protein
MELVSRTSCQADLTTDLEGDNNVKEGDGTDDGDDDGDNDDNDGDVVYNPFDNEEEGLVVITVDAEDQRGVKGHDESPFFVGDAAASSHHRHAS